jgi:hypothetical protein
MLAMYVLNCADASLRLRAQGAIRGDVMRHRAPLLAAVMTLTALGTYAFARVCHSGDAGWWTLFVTCFIAVVAIGALT